MSGRCSPLQGRVHRQVGSYLLSVQALQGRQGHDYGEDLQALQGRQGGPVAYMTSSSRSPVDVGQCCFLVFCSSSWKSNAMHFRRRTAVSLAWDYFSTPPLKTQETALSLNHRWLHKQCYYWSGYQNSVITGPVTKTVSLIGQTSQNSVITGPSIQNSVINRSFSSKQCH